MNTAATSATAECTIRRFAKALERKFRIAPGLTIDQLSDPRREAAVNRSWTEKMWATGTGTNIPSVTRPAIEAVPQLLGKRPEIRALEVGVGCNADYTSEEKVSVTNPENGETEALIVTEPWQLAHQLAKVTNRFNLDVLDVEPPLIDWIEKAKTKPPSGKYIPAGLYDRVISGKLHAILGDVLDLCLHEKFEGEYDLIVAMGVLGGLVKSSEADQRSLAAASFLLLLLHLKPDGVFLTNSDEVDDFARKIGFPNLAWYPAEFEGMPLPAKIYI